MKIAILFITTMLAACFPRRAPAQEQYAAQLATWNSSVVDVYGKDGKVGSGFVVGEKGGRRFIATAAHVVDDADEIVLRFPDADASVAAELYRQNRHYDIAILAVPASADAPDPLPYIANPQVGDPVFLINTRMNGREVLSRDGTAIITSLDEEVLECNVGVRAGNSGTALFTPDGLVGLVLQDPGLARPMALVKELAQEWNVPWDLEEKNVERAVAVPTKPNLNSSVSLPILSAKFNGDAQPVSELTDGRVSTHRTALGSGVLTLTFAKPMTFNRIKFWCPVKYITDLPSGSVSLPTAGKTFGFSKIKSPVVERFGEGVWISLELKKYYREQEIHLNYFLGTDPKKGPNSYWFFEVVVEGPANQ